MLNDYFGVYLEFLSAGLSGPLVVLLIVCLLGALVIASSVGAVIGLGMRSGAFVAVMLHVGRISGLLSLVVSLLGTASHCFFSFNDFYYKDPNIYARIFLPVHTGAIVLILGLCEFTIGEWLYQKMFACRSGLGGLYRPSGL